MENMEKYGRWTYPLVNMFGNIWKIHPFLMGKSTIISIATLVKKKRANILKTV
jgi:hypothetical protein